MACRRRDLELPLLLPLTLALTLALPLPLTLAPALPWGHVLGLRSRRLTVVVVMVLLVVVEVRRVLGCPQPTLLVRVLALCRTAGLGALMLLCLLVL